MWMRTTSTARSARGLQSSAAAARGDEPKKDVILHDPRV